jgi:hypothetical protein
MLLLACVAPVALGADTPAPAKLPKPQFQGDFFGEMARAFGFVQGVDTKARTMTVKLEKDGKVVTLPIRDDTELRFRDSWGELSDYFPGQRVMLFVYVDENRAWTYPRAVQDEIQVSAFHGWFGTVTEVDAAKGTYGTHREEKDKTGKVTKVEDKHYAFDPAAVRVWKGPTPAGIDALRVGDEVVPQLVEKDGKVLAVEILDRAGCKAVRATQDDRHRAAQDRLGLPGYVNDVEVLTGALTLSIAWSGSERGKAIKPGDTLAIAPADGGAAFGAAVVSNGQADSRRRLVVAINARVAARLAPGQSLRVFVPGTGPEVPTGKAGVPDSAYKTSK